MKQGDKVVIIKRNCKWEDGCSCFKNGCEGLEGTIRTDIYDLNEIQRIDDSIGITFHKDIWCTFKTSEFRLVNTKELI